MADKDYKYDQGKSRVDLIDPQFILDMGYVLEMGAAKYKEDSWKEVDNGINRYYGSLKRHMLHWRKGESMDKESKLSHLAHIAVNAMFLYHLEKEAQNGNKGSLGDA